MGKLFVQEIPQTYKGKETAVSLHMHSIGFAEVFPKEKKKILGNYPEMHCQGSIEKFSLIPTSLKQGC